MKHVSANAVGHERRRHFFVAPVPELPTLTFLSAALFLAACGSAGDDPPSEESPPALCEAGSLQVTPEGIGFVGNCPGGSMHLLPRVRIDGVWSGGQPPDGCEPGDQTLRCAVGDVGHLQASIHQSTVQLQFEASVPVVVEALALEGPATVPGASGWLSNGFQSWSQSGVVAIAPPLAPEVVEAALLQRGDAEVDRWGNELSWWYTFAGGTGLSLFAGALSADRLRPWAQVTRAEGDALQVRLGCGGAGERVTLTAGDVLTGERWQVELGTDLEAQLTRYAQSIPSRRFQRPVPAEAGWNSWYELWDSVDEQAVKDNAALAQSMLSSRLPPGTPLRIVIDDGWQVAWGEWEPNAKFPTGLAQLAAELKTSGHTVGIWLAPLLVAEDSVLVADHPAWFVENASYNHVKHGTMRILDVTDPDAAAHLTGVVSRIVSWGFDLLKIDFLFAGTFEGQRAQDVTGMEAYHEALRIIRNAAGENTILLAVGAPPMVSFPYVDAWRVGADIALEPFGASWFFVPNQARSIAARWPMCLATLCDADPPLLRKLPREEVETGSWVVALSGGALFLSDDLRLLPEERRAWGLDDQRVSLSLGGLPSVPVDPYPLQPPETLTNAIIDHVSRNGQHEVPVVWRTPDGARVGINFTDEDLVLESIPIPAHAARVLP